MRKITKQQCALYLKIYAAILRLSAKLIFLEQLAALLLCVAVSTISRGI